MATDARVGATTTALPPSVGSADPQDTLRFKEWLIAKELVNRRNRNLLQYAAGLAALLGIGGATTGVFALASSLRGGTQQSLGWIGYGALLLGLLLAVVLGALVVKSIAARRRAEREADERMLQLPPDLLFKSGLLSEAATQ